MDLDRERAAPGAIRQPALPIAGGERHDPAGTAVDDTTDIAAKDVIASAEAAIEEIRRQIDFQAKAADGLDTKAAGILTLTGVAAGVVVGSIHVETDMQRLSAVVAGMVIVLALLSASQALRPRSGWSFGADAATLVALVDRYPRNVVLLSLCDSLVQARTNNAKAIDAKQTWYSRGLRGIVASLLALGWMVQTGGLR
jgi:hypothetical protein